MSEAIQEHETRRNIRRRALRAAQVASLCLTLAGGGLASTGCGEAVDADAGSGPMDSGSMLADTGTSDDSGVSADAGCDTDALSRRLFGSSPSDFDCTCDDVRAYWQEDADCCLEYATSMRSEGNWDSSRDPKCETEAIAVPGPFVPPAMLV